MKRILEAYVMMKQLRDEKDYKSESSQVKGRGSNVNYPFSWVYTSIGYENIRNWIDISGLNSQSTVHAQTKVLKSEQALENSEKLVGFLFGSSHKGIRSAVAESRQLGRLNDVVKNKVSVRELEHGKSLDEVWENLKPVDDRLEELFYDTQEKLKM